MNRRVLRIAIAAALVPAVLPAQQPASDTTAIVSATRESARPARPSVRLTSGASVLPLTLPDARLALPDSGMGLDLRSPIALPRRWVRTGKWSLLVAAAGFSAYAMMHGGGDTPDSRAQIGIAGGYLSLLGSAGLFIYDLRNSRRDPDNIPFESASAGSPARGLTAGAGVSAER